MVRVLVHLFSAVAHFTLVAAGISHFLTASTKFHVVSRTKMSPLFFLSRSSSSSLRSTVALLSLFLFLSLYLFSKFLDMTINLNLIIWTTRDTETFSAFRVCLY